MVKKSTTSDQKTEIELGEKLRKIRKQASLTMQYVADNAGLSVGFISQVERGLTVPSLSSLRSIAGVLSTPISHFLEQPSSDTDTTRQKDRVNYSVGQGALSYERLSAGFAGSTLRSVIVHEPPGHRNEPISHEGEELFYILQGEITVEVEGERKVLRRGDSIHFDSRKTHATWNHTDTSSAMLWCGTMDVFGEDTTDPIHKNNNKTGKKTRSKNKGDTT
ncbi:MAG: transcriptional regulator with XRE-family HTH domain [Paracoccaceae bacterium]|jgi:transcriptional regulator with XRE-family HTH domain